MGAPANPLVAYSATTMSRSIVAQAVTADAHHD